MAFEDLIVGGDGADEPTAIVSPDLIATRNERKGLTDFSARARQPVDFGTDDEVVGPAPRTRQQTLDFGTDDEVIGSAPIKNPPMPRARPAEAPGLIQPTQAMPEVQPLDNAPFRAPSSGMDTNMLTGEQAYAERSASIKGAEAGVAEAQARLDAALARQSAVAGAAPRRGTTGGLQRQAIDAEVENAKANLDTAQQALSAAERAAPPTQTKTRDAASRFAQAVGTTIPDVVGGLARPVDAALDAVGLPGGTGVAEKMRGISKKVGIENQADPAREDELVAQLGQGGGSAVGFIVTGAIGRGAKLSAAAGSALAGAAQNAEQYYREADDMGAPAYKKALAYVTGGAIGSTEGVGLGRLGDALEHMDKASGGAVKRYFGLVMKEMGEEGLQEGVQQLLDNMAKYGLYGKDPGDITKDVARNALVGAMLGMGMAGVTGLPSLVRGRATEAGVPVPEQAQITPEEIIRQILGQPSTPPAVPAQNVTTSPDDVTAQQTGPTPAKPEEINPQPSNVSALPVETAPEEITPPAPSNPVEKINTDDAALLRGYGYDAQQIADMSPAQIASEVAAAKEAGTQPAFGDGDHVVGTRSAPVEVKTAADLKQAVAPASAEHTPAQAEANNRPLGHMTWNGLDASIEAGPGEGRKWLNKKTGETGETVSPAAIGYFKGTVGGDGMHLDVYFGPNPASKNVWVVDEQDGNTGQWRQHKVMAGFDTEQEARDAYLGTSSKSEKTLSAITPMSVDELKDWIAKGDLKKPLVTTKAVTPRAQPKASEPTSLLQFIASKGGLAPDPELTAIGVTGSHRVNVPGRTGRFPVVRATGMSLDQMREAAEEAGYFRGTGNATSTVRDFLDAVDNETRGQRRLPEGQEADPSKRETQRLEEENANRDALLAQNRAEIEAMLESYGVPAGMTNDADLKLAAEIMADEGLDPDAALERAAIRNLESDQSVPAEQVEAIYGFGVFDEVVTDEGSGKARSEKNAGVPDLGSDENALQQSEGQGISALRRQGDRRLSGVEQQLPPVLRGHGDSAESEAQHRARRRDEGLQQEQLPVGNRQRAGVQSAGLQPPSDARRQDANGRRVGGRDRDVSRNAPLPNEEGVAGRSDTHVASVGNRGSREADHVQRQDHERDGMGEGRRHSEERSGEAIAERMARGASADDTAARHHPDKKGGVNAIQSRSAQEDERNAQAKRASGVRPGEEGRPDEPVEHVSGAGEDRQGSGEGEARQAPERAEQPSEEVPERVAPTEAEQTAASRAMETALDKIEEAVESGDRKAVLQAGRDARKVLADTPQSVKDAEGGRSTETPEEMASVARVTTDSGRTASLSPERRANLERALTDVVRKIAGPSVAVRFVDEHPINMPKGWGSFGQDKVTAAGSYIPAQSLITVALADPAYPLEQVLDTTFHEAFHALEDKILTEQEMAVLKREDARLREVVKRAYGFTAEQIAEIAGFEIRAMAFEYYASRRAKGLEPQGLHIGIRRAFERLIDLFRRVRNLLNGLGYRNANDIFEAAFDGRYADRRGAVTESATEQAAMRPSTPKYEVVHQDSGTVVNPQPLSKTDAEQFRRGMGKGFIVRPVRRQTDEQANIRPQGNLNRFESYEPLPERWQDWWKRPDLNWRDRAWGMLDAAFLKTNRALGDRYVDMRRLQAAVELTGRPVNEGVNMALSATLFEGKTEKRLKDYWLKLWKPVLDFAYSQGVTREDIHRYLYARHAPERNAHIAEINPLMPEGGSGMTDAEAQEIMDAFAADGKREVLEQIAQRIDGIVRKIRSMMVDDQLEHEETIRAWEHTYQHYVPLRGFESGDEDMAQELQVPRAGRGFDVRGPETKQALGRRSKADDILTNLFLMGERTIIRGEQNRVGRTAMRFMQSNPQPSLYEVSRSERVLTDGRTETTTENDIDLLAGERPITVQRVNRETGMVESVTRVASAFANNSFAVKVGGHTYYITIKHPGLLTALKNVGIQRLPWRIQAHSWLTRQFSAFRTARNPDFFVPNLFRDIQDAAYTLGAEQRSSLVKNFAGNIATLRTYVAAFMGELMESNSTLGDVARRKFADKRLAQLYEDWKKNGGQIAFMGINDMDTARKEIEAAFHETEESYAATVAKAPFRLARSILRAIEFFNGAIEAGTRLAVYDAGVKAGMTKAKAAELSKESTTNFNRKGIYSPYLNAFYAFFNARVQGATKIIRLLRNSKMARRAAIGLVLAGFSTTLWNLAVSPDDEDKKPEYMRRKYWERERYFIFYFPGSKDPVRIPMGYGLQLFWMLGENLAMASQGRITPAQAAANYLSTIESAFSPLQAEGSAMDPGTWLRYIMPSVEMPLLELGTNEDWRRKPIHPKYGKKGEPHSEQYFTTTSPYAVDVAQFLNRVSGGNAFKPGAVDLYPGDLQYVWNFAAGGLGQTTNRTSTLFNNWMEGVPTPPNQVPILRNFVGANVEQATGEAYYEDKREVEAGMGQVRRAMKAPAASDDAAKTVEEGVNRFGVHQGKRRGTVGSDAETIFRNADKQLKGLRALEQAARNDKTQDSKSRAALIADLRAQMRQVQEEARKAYREIKKREPTF